MHDVSVRRSLRGRPSIRGLAALLGAALLLGACGPALRAAPIDTTGPSAVEPTVVTASTMPTAAPPTDAVADAIAAEWRREPFDPRDDDRVSLIDASCNAAGQGLPFPPRDLIDARGENRLVIVCAADPTSTAFACFADIGATTASEVQLLQLQDEGAPPIADADIDVGYYGPASFGRIQAMVLVGRVGLSGARVVAELADGTTVVATKRGGWYAMWWPGPTLAASVSSLDSHGVVIGTATPRL
jgi:hypothetical protein